MGATIPEPVQHVVEDQSDDAWLRQFQRAKSSEPLRRVPQYACLRLSRGFERVGDRS
jgi:hypothetical protein